MKIVVQRVSEASVKVEGKTVGTINYGLMLLVGIEDSDETIDADVLTKKIINLRIFSDEHGKMNRSILDIQGSILCISQFTLMAEYKKGNRPSFLRAAKPDKASIIFDYFKERLSKYGLKVESGIFGEDMKVSLINDGPVTIVMDSHILK